MTKLSDEALQRYRDESYYAPIRTLPAEDAARLRRALEAFETARPGERKLLRSKSHLVFTWADELIRTPAILDAVESVICPNILCWGSCFFIKDAHDPSYVSWHQDSTNWGLEPPDIVTAWVALSESVAENGAMRVIPGTQKLDQVAHRDTFASHNLLSRGQEIVVEVDEHQAIPLELQPGEMSLHHVRLVLGSEPNPSGRRRIGFAIRYLPTHVHQSPARATARSRCAAWMSTATLRRNAGPTLICRKPPSPSTRKCWIRSTKCLCARPTALQRCRRNRLQPDFACKRYSLRRTACKRR